MNPTFEITIEKYEKLTAMPESWPAAACRTLLATLEFDGADELADEELRSYAAMALQDLEPEEAASVVLAHTLGELMTAGQIQNLREEMKDDRKWEEGADMRAHEPIFNAQILLSEAFPDTYAVPDIVRLTALVRSLGPDGETLLGEPISEPLLVRMLADGMPDSAVLKRLFEDSLAKGPFPEASQILWQYKVEALADDDAPGVACRVVLCSPKSWVGALEDVETFSSAAFPDEN